MAERRVLLLEVLNINGAEKEFPEGLPKTLSELLEHLDIKAATVVAEIDGKIIERNKFAQSHLHSGQDIELIRFVGGG